MNHEITVIDVARICHEANRAYCLALGDNSQSEWSTATDWQKISAINGVHFHLAGDRTAEESHENWLKEKLADGWTYGLVKDTDRKEHPCCMPYAQLPDAQKIKDLLFIAIITVFKDRDPQE